MGRDWNEVDPSQSEDSNHEQQQLSKQQHHQQQANSGQQSTQIQASSHHKSLQNQSSKLGSRQNQEKFKFLSDEQLIQKIKNKQLQERRKIKIVKCYAEELIQMIRTHKLVSYFKQIKIGDKPPFYILSFQQQQDLITFIQEKITNRYKFFLQPYIKTARDLEREKQRQEKRNQRNQQDQKSRYNNRKDDRRENDREQRRRDNREQTKRQPQDRRKTDDRQRRRQGQGNRKANRNRPQYDEESSSQKRAVIKNEVKNEKPIVSENIQKPQKSKDEQFNFEIENNIITIKENKYSKNRIVDQIVDRKITNKWNKIKIHVKPNGLDKALQLVELIHEKMKFGLKKLPDENTEQQYIEIILEENCHIKNPNSQYRLLSNNQKKYFEDIKDKNKYKITKQFIIEEYVKGFKDNQTDICKKWNIIYIKAEEDNIQNLLKLSWRLKKELYLNIDIKIGSRGDIPHSILQIKPQTDKEKRPKVDASFVNSYLTN